MENDLSSSETEYRQKVGYVAIYANLVWYDLDFSDLNWTDYDSNCSEELSFHIHDKWTYGDSGQSIGSGSVDRMGVECHENFTGRHFDPWMACGPTSGSVECESNGGCIPSSSVYMASDSYQGAYSCDEENFDLIAYACEMGDLSGKYGGIEATQWDNITNETVGVHTWGLFGSYWEVLQTILLPTLNNDPAEYSLVIHCGDALGDPLFCAPIVKETNSNIPDLTLADPETIEIDFSEAGEAYHNFTITFTNEGITFHVPKSAADLCNDWYLLLYEEYPYYETGAAFVNCDIDLFSGIYDPTHTCIADSGSPYCIDQVRCPNQTNVTVTYECVNTNNYQGCAVGDISSRIGSITPDFGGGGDFWDNTFDLTANSPPLFILNQRGVVLTCLDGNNAALNETENICAGTFCENCTQTLAPIDTRPPTAVTDSPTTADPTSEPTSEPTTAEPTESPTKADDGKGKGGKKGLDGGAIAGVVIGVVAFLAIIAVLVWFFVIRPRKTSSSNDDDDDAPESEQVEMNTKDDALTAEAEILPQVKEALR